MADVQEVFRLQRLEGPEAARAQLERAAAAHDGSPHFHLMRAEQAMQSRALAAAEAEPYRVLVPLADVQMRLGLPDEARETLDAAIAERATAPVLVARGYVAEELGALDDAIGLYRRAVAADPGNVIASNNLAMALIRADRNPDEALTHARYAYETLPDNALVLGTYALAMALTEGEHASVKLLHRAVRATPDDPWLRYALGRRLAEIGRHEEARMHLEAVALLARDFPRRAEVDRLLAAQ